MRAIPADRAPEVDTGLVPVFLPPSKAKPPPPPLRTDDRGAVLVGLGVWAVLLVVALAVPEVRSTGEGRWLGSCVAGLGLGLVGLAFLHHRDRRDRGTRPPRR